MYEAYVIHPCPPETETQGQIGWKFAFTDENGTTLHSETRQSSAGAPFKQELWSRVTSSTPFRELHESGKYTGVFYGPHSSSPLNPVPAAIPPDPYDDYDSPEFATYLQSHPEFQRKSGETAYKFARRVFEKLPYTLPTYVYNAAKESHIASSTLPTDCGGSAMKFVSVMNAGGVPALLCTGMAPDAAIQNHAELNMRVHAIARVGTELGWFPVDVSAQRSVSKDTPFQFWDDNKDWGFFIMGQGDHYLPVNPFTGARTRKTYMTSQYTIGLGLLESNSESWTMTCSW
jgi:hypothetical protein